MFTSRRTDFPSLTMCSLSVAVRASLRPRGWRRHALGVSLAATVLSAHGQGFVPVIELSSLDGSTGFALNGARGSDLSGRSVSSAGDVNGDGFDDVIIGADGADPNGIDRAGTSYVVFGRSDGFASSVELSNLGGSTGFAINGVARNSGIGSNQRSATTVSSAGDVNGDGFGDVIIGAYNVDSIRARKAGSSYVVFGQSDGFASSVELSSLDGSTGFALNGIRIDDKSGISVSSAGDVNGDGFDDVLIGAFTADPNGVSNAGTSYVVFGQSDGFASSVELSSLDGSTGFALNGGAPIDLSGSSVSSAGDVNGDGFDDVLIGAHAADPKGLPDAGMSYVVFGQSDGFESTVELSSLDGSTGFALHGAASNDSSGTSVSSAGDVNGDGFDDVIIGAFGASPNGLSAAGTSYVVFGQSDGFASSVELSSLDGSTGFALNSVARGDLSGFSVSSAGDVNGDGYDDVLIGAYRADPNGIDRAGASYVVFGQKDGFASSVELSSLDWSTGFVLNGVAVGDFSGSSVSSAGDVNGDGFDDVLIGAPRADPNGRSHAGSSYVVFGGGAVSSQLLIDDLTVSEADGVVMARVTLIPASSNAVSVSVFTREGTAQAGQDFNGFTRMVDFAPGETEQRVPLTILNDAVIETSETVLLRLTGASGATVADNEGTVNILDDDAPVLTPTVSIEDTTVSEADGVAQVRVLLSAPASAPGSVRIHTRNRSAMGGQDYYGFTRDVAFAVGDTEQFVGVTLLNDGQREPTETMELRLFDPTGLMISQPLGTVTVLDDDDEATQSARVSVDDAWFTESDGRVSIRVSLSNPLPINTSVLVHTRSQTAMQRQDYYGFTRTLDFAAGETEKLVSLTVLNDTVEEPTETLLLRVARVTGAGLSVGKRVGVVTIMDND